MSVIEKILKHKEVTLTVLLIVVLAGIYSLLFMPRREDPKITVPVGLVTAIYPGASSEQVEQQVTKKLEQTLFQFDEVRKEQTTSVTTDGLAQIYVQLEENVKNPDIFWNKLRHQLLLTKAMSLPQGVVAVVVNSDFGDTEALLVSMECNDASYAEINGYLQKMEDSIRTITAVSKIKLLGQQKEQITITSHSDKLSQYGVDLQQVVKVLQSQNNIGPTGNLKTDDNQVSFYSNGHYDTETQLGNQIVGSSKTGAPIRLKDIADVKREYAEPSDNVTVNGNKAMILTIQMHEGHNIVAFGKEVQKKIDAVRKVLPAKVHINTIVNQPAVVDANITHFIREFFIAIAAVIIVVMLLLPFRIALVAAMAIPVTIATTFALMNIVGIELHQVSLAALIVVLGLVVDDAIVIADNYVELLDEGENRWDAAWKSASTLMLPVFAATATIIAAFMPMIVISGVMGEFIESLPITVALALSASFIVAMVLTPFLCFTFIRKGLHEAEEGKRKGNKKPHKFLLDYMQNGYNWLLEKCVKHPRPVIALSLISIVLAGLLMKTSVRQKFFPAAERNQFMVEVWMPTGTKVEKTREALAKIENLIKHDKRVVSYASFAGQPAPRVYYNYSPELGVPSYGMMLINTPDDATTLSLADELEKKVATLVPEGMPQVKLMQQGMPVKAPVEVRIYGDDITRLKQLGAQVEGVLRQNAGSDLVRTDFREDYYGIGVNLKPEAARLGFTTQSIATLIYAGFTGAPVSTIYEGDNPVNVVFRFSPDSRQNMDNLLSTYIPSPATGENVPLQQIASIQPEWHTGRIMHRNGLLMLTVQSETKNGVLPSELLAQVQPKIAQLQLPYGYHIEYGGEADSKTEPTQQIMIALSLSLLFIFLILLFQFKSLKEALIIMLTIPLSLFGAILGLVITGNNFGFTAFLGLIALSGIVVRNAIILVDHTNELMHNYGMSLREASIESGKRRLRPIFLTAMAAAIGVMPMIISRSPMWAPLASVLAVGVVWSMITALVTVPILCIAWLKPEQHEKTPDEKL